MKIIKPLLLVFVLIGIFAFALFAQEQLTITTYYPSPYGVYNKLRLFPHTETSPCPNSGEIYYNGTVILLCDSTNNWVPIATGTTSTNWWNETSVGSGDIYNNNTGSVLIGINSPSTIPAARLEVNGRSELHAINETALSVSTKDNGSAFGIMVTATTRVSGAPTYGISAMAMPEDSTTTGGDYTGILGEAFGSAAGTYYGLYGHGQGSLPASSTAYGLYATANNGSTNWAGYFDDGDVYIKNNLGIGTLTPGAPLDVVGRSLVRGSGGGGGGFWLSNSGTPATFTSFVGRGNNAENQVGFYNNGAWRLVIKDATSNVGIGTATPTAGMALDVAGIIQTDYLKVNPQNNASEGGEIQLDGAGANPTWQVDVYDDRIRFHSSGAEKLTVYQNADLLIWGSNATKASGTLWITPSDSRLKNILGPIRSALNVVSQLKPVQFKWNDVYRKNYVNNEKLQYGFIAQDVKKVIPEFVLPKDEKGYLKTDLSGIEAILTAAIQELKAEKDKELKQLREENTNLEKRLEALEKKVK